MSEQPVHPRVSVLIPAFNAGRYIGEAIESVLAQSWTDFELIVVDDGSSDDTAAVCAARARADSRVRLISQQRNRGRPWARNEALRCARGEFVAMLDADDRCMPDRLATQVAFLQAHPTIDVVGSWWHTIDENGQRLPPNRNKQRYLTADAVISYLLFCGIIHNPTVMARTEVLHRHGYDSDFPVAQDYHLWGRMVGSHRFAIIPRPLTEYRVHPTQASSARALEARARRRDIQAAQLDALGMTYDEEDLVYHNLIYSGRKLFEAHAGRPMDREYVRWASRWLPRLVAANQRFRRYPEPAFSRLVARLWGQLCRKASRDDAAGVWREFLACSLSYRLPRAVLADLNDARRMQRYG
ncbi:glycosyltransferase family A protein [Salinisphaera sp.]|uniref:glycosyltransferase family 2 protein n=1 Tax=Salinisphaera sp. TaxID=1914330 RepID=UPI002D79F59E|nr:glycosyltransferase family A protein [Salinisphaera sp.]HET7313109.1 glycosyltransferase family A protein [Salinisphaera sp.]